MTEPQIGDRVWIRLVHGDRLAEVTEVITAGRPGGTGIYIQRRRVQVRFEEDGRKWTTFRDLDAIRLEQGEAVKPVKQGELFSGGSA